MGEYTQDNRKISVQTPLGKDVLLFKGLTGHEGLSTLFELEVLAIAEKNAKVVFDKLLGKKVTVKLKMGDDESPTYLNGLCNGVAQGRRDEYFLTYRLSLVPELWLLTRKAQSRIFQQLTVPEILRKVLKGFDVDYKLNGRYEPRDYCVQYRETDFAFASRLMEEEGVYYYFKHGDGSHQMVVADTTEGHADVPGETTIEYEELAGGLRAEERIYAWEKYQEMRSGKVTLWDHCFELPHRHLEAEEPTVASVRVGTVTHKLKVGGNDKLELYDWPGGYAQRFDGVEPGGGDRQDDIQKIFRDNERTATIRMDEETAPAIRISGKSSCKQMRAGHRFDLSRHFNADGSYVVLETTHDAEETGDYRSGVAEIRYAASFRCFPADIRFRPPRTTPKPVIAGTQSAVVVGPSGEEVFTDKYGRVKVQFHWDREGKKDANSSCWIRVGQLFAGRRWGASFWPRIGQEVLVAFHEGDPDCPVIVGSVYNADQMPPYLGDGPDDKHENDNKVSGVKSNTTTGGEGFNELRFDDTKGKEQVFIHSQGNMDEQVCGSSMVSVGGSRHLTVGSEDSGDHLEKASGSRHVTVGGEMQVKVGGAMRLTVEETQDLVVKGAKKEHLRADSDLVVDGTAASQISGDCRIQVSQNVNAAVDADATFRARRLSVVAEEAYVEGSSSVYLRCGRSYVMIRDGRIEIESPAVDINCSQSSAIPITPDLPESGAVFVAEEAAPRAPSGADDAETGQKSCSDSGI
ncbi:MAG: type VI secretion system tip protein VgrG [Thermoanaerobaculia bacterium]|nr:type VI secretion system tip protein VgrG [Thermoanaerobaculia bacterium]